MFLCKLQILLLCVYCVVADYKGVSYDETNVLVFQSNGTARGVRFHPEPAIQKTRGRSVDLGTVVCIKRNDHGTGLKWDCESDSGYRVVHDNVVCEAYPTPLPNHVVVPHQITDGSCVYYYRVGHRDLSEHESVYVICTISLVVVVLCCCYCFVDQETESTPESPSTQKESTGSSSNTYLHWSDGGGFGGGTSMSFR